MARIEGGCLCGAVRYRSEAEPAMQVICHCKTCQKNSGSAFSMNVAIPQDSLTTQGDALRSYIDHSGASGQPFYRYYCSSCGSHIYSHGAAYGPVAFIKAGTLDDATWLAPSVHIWVAEKLPWVAIPDGTTQYPGNPS
ncbi:GFA family protein [Methylobacterium sp. WSM2598]|uniref:GFA family protein n=1 Tax=Methylobacterium sp. WSM2598 TaxID=398261 RepID=UPI0009FDDAF0|nr:GFA family protein [Methylobacterium sp. WSM2598]